MAKAKRKRRASFRTMEADAAVSALDEFERLERLEAERRAQLAAEETGDPAAGDDALAGDDLDEDEPDEDDRP